jgi:cytochrome P450
VSAHPSPFPFCHSDHSLSFHSILPYLSDLTLCAQHSFNSNAPPVAFWFIYEALKSPSLHAQIMRELRANVDPSHVAYDFMHLTTRPILQSLHAETARYYSATVTVRVVTSSSFALDDKFSIDKGTLLFIYNKFTGIFTPGWTLAGRQLTLKSLDEFWPERFLVVSNSSSKDHDHGNSDGNENKVRFNDSNLTGSWTSFGGGEHLCPGRHFARNIGIVTLAVLLGEFECELVGGEVERPGVRETAFGKMVPERKVRARLRRRNLSE